MKTKLVVVLFMLLITFFAKAETTYLHDSAVCSYKDHSFILEIRGADKYTGQTEGEYGSTVVVKNGKTSKKIDMNDEGFGRYRMLKVYNDICPKDLVLPMKENEIGFLLLKDNRPFTDILVVLYYNLKTNESEVISTKLAVKSGLLRDKKIFLKMGREELHAKSGRIDIQGVNYQYTERPFEPWFSFDGVHFKYALETTFENFEYKRHVTLSTLSEIKDVYHRSFWVAHNRSIKSTCFSFDKQNWNCQRP